jgi:hypothetical protein
MAIFFPALPGFSLKAARDQMNGLPPGFVLSGANSTAMAIAMWPQHLSKLHLVASAVSYEHDDISLCFKQQSTVGIPEITHTNLYANGIPNLCSGIIYCGTP